jgi:heterotetrameric sarcosine oxidase gamma subunit
MVEALKPRSALESAYRPGPFGAVGAAPGVTLAERRGGTRLHVECRGDDAESVLKLADALGTALPAAGKAAEKNGRRALWLGPARWLVTGGDLPDLAAAAPEAAINDVSSAKTVIRISGPASRDVLASGCPLDLDAAVFKPGMTASSLIGHYTVLIDCIDADTFDLYVARGFALSFWQWLTENAAEFGAEVKAAI